MDKVHNAVAWYQKKIGAYDKQFWEQSVEKKLRKGQTNVHHASKKIVRLKTEFIDVDLIRGSTFSKAKPQVPWIYITKKTTIRLIFLPLCFRWWVQQTSKKFYFLLLVLYFMQLTSLCIYVKNVGIATGIEDEVSLTEVMTPMVLMMVLGFIHTQTMLSHYSHKALYRDGKLARHYQKSKKRNDIGTETGVSDQGKSSESHKNKTSRSRNINVTSTEDLTHERLGSSISVRHGITCEKLKSDSSFSLVQDDSSVVAASSSVQTDHTVQQGQSVVSKRSKESNTGSKQRLSRLISKDKLNKVSSRKDESAEKVSQASLRLSESNILPPEILQESDDDEMNDGKFEVLSVEQLDESNVTVPQLSLPRKTTGEILTQPVRKAGELEDVILESSAPWKSLDSYRKRLMEEDNFADTERASDDGPSDTEPESGSFNRSSTNEDMINLDPQNDEAKIGSTSTDENVKKDEEYRSEIESTSANENLKDTGNENVKPEAECAKKSPANENVKYVYEETSAKEQDMKNIKIKKVCKLPESARTTPGSENDVELALHEHDRPVSSSGTVIRRRRRVSASRSADIGEVMRSRNVPNSLGLRQSFRTSTKQSSSENETTPTSEKENRVSSEEFENRMHSDVTTSSSYSSSCASEAEGSESGEANPFSDHKPNWTASSFHVINLLQPPTASNTGMGTINPPDEVSCMIWEGNECRKVDLTAFDIGWAIIDKVDNIPESSDYVLIGIAFTIIMGCFPLIFRAYNMKDLPVIWSVDGLLSAWHMIQLNSWKRNFLTINGVFQRLCLSLIFFFLLSVADRTFKQRLLYAKHFCYLTSSRRARKFDMPHFRLNKVRNIKIWLSLRSYLKRRGPQRSVDIIVSASFLVAVSLVTLMCLKMLKDTDTYLDYMCNWEIVIWCLALGTYLLRFMTLGLKINKKYRSLSVLITEQINLYLQMEQKPHKKEELMLANNVLKLAEELLKELESPFKISGFSANPFIYNVTKVVVLSAFSAVLTELLGFKLKLYKIKFKA